jgi:hypothetical protein
LCVTVLGSSAVGKTGSSLVFVCASIIADHLIFNLNDFIQRWQFSTWRVDSSVIITPGQTWLIIILSLTWEDPLKPVSIFSTFQDHPAMM